MPTPEPLAHDRLEALLRGLPPEGEREARVAGVVRELRAETPGASRELRERVRALHATEPRPRFTRRRLALVLVPALLIAVVGAAAVLRDEPQPERGAAQLEYAPGPRPAARARAPRGRWHAEVPPTALDANTAASSAGAMAAGRARAREVDAWLRLRLPSNDALSEAANEAMGIARELRGTIARSDFGTRGASGRAHLLLRVPVARVQDAIVRLSELGTITGQRMTIQDRQDELDARARRIASLRQAIRIGELRLRSATLSSEERLRLQIRLERQRGLLSLLARQNRAVTRETAVADISLELRTGRGAASPDAGGITGAARDAVDFLTRAGAVVVFLLIVLSPLVALAALLALGRRAYRRREEERLLARPGPQAPQT